MIYRKAGIGDIDALVRLRRQQLIDEESAPETDIDRQLAAYFRESLEQEGPLVMWVLEDEGEIVATSAIVFYQFPPCFSNPSGQKGYITSMYTKASHRGQGIATALLDRLVGEARDRGVPELFLCASAMGRPVYEKFGFAEQAAWLEMNL